MAGRLEIHIFGGNIGESVVVGLPYGGWGVIDNYTPNFAQPKSSATIRFLEEKGITTLEFLCLTHPHEDHVRGARHLIERYSFRQFWSFGAFTPAQLYAKVEKVLRRKAAARNDPEPDEEFVDDLVAGLQTARDRAKASQTEIQRTQLGLVLYHAQPTPTDPPVRITAIGPSGRSAMDYEDQLDAVFDPSASQEILVERIMNVNHNLISSALVIEFGNTRVVLGGDMEERGWQDAIRHTPQVALTSHLVKVSHHGSTNGYCERLWEDHFSPQQSATAVVTAFTKKGLPRAEGISHIKKNSAHLLTTSKSSVMHGRSSSSSASAFPNLPLDAVLALRTVFSVVRPKAVQYQGACSFSFDSEGKFTVATAGDAGAL